MIIDGPDEPYETPDFKEIAQDVRAARETYNLSTNRTGMVDGCRTYFIMEYVAYLHHQNREVWERFAKEALGCASYVNIIQKIVSAYRYEWNL